MKHGKIFVNVINVERTPNVNFDRSSFDLSISYYLNKFLFHSCSVYVSLSLDIKHESFSIEINNPDEIIKMRNVRLTPNMTPNIM